MADWDSYRDGARKRGALGWELFVVHSVPTAPPEEVQAVLPDHLAYQSQLEEAGTLVMAGPVSDETGTRADGMGMMIYRAASLEEATRIARADPMHARGARSFAIRKWLVNEGALSVNLRLSAQAVSLG
ncbi:YciI family protein [Pseudooceanicola aestuarii]|uniref:YciI family protein n=1 Tax=Pseudooceanicola aestuarii TaxID=2697319 RepID=UPI0013D5A29A|nr:YciI family protein [Pseudooceanicola aestuarii]